MIPNTLRSWMGAVKRMEADPGTPASCPLCNGGTLAVRDIRSEADPAVGTRIIRYTHCDHHSTSRYHLGPQAAPTASAAALVTQTGHGYAEAVVNPNGTLETS